MLHALARLELGNLPEPLHAAVATALEWAHDLDRQAAEAGEAARRPR